MTHDAHARLLADMLRECPSAHFTRNVHSCAACGSGAVTLYRATYHCENCHAVWRAKNPVPPLDSPA